MADNKDLKPPERILPENKDYQDPGVSTAGMLVNPFAPLITTFGDFGYLEKDNMQEIRRYIEDNGAIPSESQLEELTGRQLFGRRGDKFYKEATRYAYEYANLNPDLKEQVEAQPEELPEYYWDEAKIHEKGTKEHDLYDFYKEFGEAQHEAGQTELARSERDMQVEMAGQRSQLMDEVRKRRQNQLRSGLSSAQIANEEIQMLLMGQQAQQETAQQHFDARTQMNQQHQMNPYMAEQQARGHIREGMQGQSAFYASGVVDPHRLAQEYGGLNEQERSEYKDIIGQGKEK